MIAGHNYALWQPLKSASLLKHKDINKAMIHIMTNGDTAQIEKIKRYGRTAQLSDDDDLSELVFFCLFNRLVCHRIC